jgi:hypothetical protein
MKRTPPRTRSSAAPPSLLSLGRVSRKDADRIKKILEARRLELELGERQGRLVGAGECEIANAAFLGCVLRAIHGAPSRYAAAIACELKLDGPAMVRIKVLLENEADTTAVMLIDDARRTLGQLGQRPARKTGKTGTAKGPDPHGGEDE